MIKKSPTQKDHQLLAMLALATGETEQTGDCPPAEQLAAFVDGELQGDARHFMLAHLNHCTACRQHWLEVADLVKAVEPEPGLVQPHKDRLSTLIRQSLEGLFVPWKLAISSAATAAIVGLALVLSVAPDIGQQIDTQYATQIHYSKALAQKAQDMPLPWESTALGFSESASSLPNRAFGAGVWSGRSTLIGLEQASLHNYSAPNLGLWSETQWDDYYQFGRWTLVLWAQVSSEQAIANWEEHRNIMAALQARMEQRQGTEQEESDALRELLKIDAQLAAVEGDSDPGAYGNLRRRLTIAIQQLAPVAP